MNTEMHTDPTWTQPEIIELEPDEPTSNIYRRVCAAAGTPIVEGHVPGPGEVIVKTGYDSPYRMATLLRRVLGDENACVMAFATQGGPDTPSRATWAAFSGRRAAYATKMRV